MDLNFDNTTFMVLLVPQVAVVALVPFIIYWFSARPASAAARVGVVLLAVAGLAGTGLCTFLAMLGVGMSQAPIGPLGARLLYMQVGIVILLLILSILAAALPLVAKIGTLGLWQMAIMSGLVSFWILTGLAPAQVNWLIVLLSLVLGAAAGVLGRLVLASAGDTGGSKAIAAWATVGVAGVGIGLAVAWLTGGLSPYAGLIGPPPLSDQLGTLVLVAAAGGVWLGLYAVATYLTGYVAVQHAALVRAFLSVLVLGVAWLVASFAVQAFYPAEYTAHLSQAVKYAVPLYANGIAVADVDKDGHADVVVKNDQFSRMQVLRGNGDGTFGTTTDCGSPCKSVTTASYQMEVSGDFDGDGKQDKASIGAAASYPLRGGAVSVRLNARGTLGKAGSYRTGAHPQCIVAADLNGDGRQDLVVANSPSRDVTFLVGNGDGTFRLGGSVPVGEYPGSLAVGELNGDSKPDIVVATYYGVSVLLGR